MDDTANGDATATAPATVAHSDSNTQPVIAEFSRVLNAVSLATESDVAAAVAAADAVPDPLDSACADNGGCMLYAVSKCAGFEALTAEDLDGEIDEVHRTFNNKTEWAQVFAKRRRRRRALNAEKMPSQKKMHHNIQDLANPTSAGQRMGQWGDHISGSTSRQCNGQQAAGAPAPDGQRAQLRARASGALLPYISGASLHPRPCTSDHTFLRVH